MTTKLTTFDPSRFLDSPEAIEAYLHAIMEENDPRLLAAALDDLARARNITGIDATLVSSRHASV